MNGERGDEEMRPDLPRETAHRKMGDGTLRDQTHHHSSHGRGVGHPCAVCDDSITWEHVEYELRFAGEADRQVARFHRDCLAAWEFERKCYFQTHVTSQHGPERGSDRVT